MIIPIEVDGHTVYVDVVDDDNKSFERVGIFSSKEDIPQKFENMISPIIPLFSSISKELKKANSPKVIEIEVGLRFNASVGITLASASANTTMKVKLSWS